MVDSLNIDNCSKTLAFEKLKRLLYKYYPKFVKAYRRQSNRLDIKQFLVLLYNCVLNRKRVWSTDKLLKNAKILKSGTGKNPTTAFVNLNLQKYQKDHMLIKVMNVLIMLQF